MLSKRTLAFGALAMGAANVIKVMIQLALLPVMAKLLQPNEFGLYALAAPTVTFVTMLADGGLGVSLAREPESSTIVWSTAFWTLLVTGIGLALGVSVWGLLLGRITDQPRVPGLISLMSISLILMTITVPSSARLTRRGLLMTAAVADLGSTLVGAAVAVTLALLGAGADSLAVQYVIGFGVRAAWINLAAFQAPRFEFSLATLRPHLATGRTIIGSKLADLSERLVGNALLSRTLGTQSLGFYTFSTQVSRFLSETPGNPIWATLYIHALQDDKRETILLYNRLCRLLGILLLPALMLVAAAAPEIIVVFLGTAWAPAATVLRVILPFYAASAISAQVGPLLLAYGRNDIAFWCSCVLSVARIFAILSGIWYGLLGVALGVALSNVLYCIIILSCTRKVIHTRPMLMIADLSGAFAAGAVAVGTYLISTKMFGTEIWSLIASVLIAVATSVITLGVIDRRRIGADLTAIKTLRRRPDVTTRAPE